MVEPVTSLQPDMVLDDCNRGKFFSYEQAFTQNLLGHLRVNEVKYLAFAGELPRAVV